MQTIYYDAALPVDLIIRAKAEDVLKFLAENLVEKEKEKVGGKRKRGEADA